MRRIVVTGVGGPAGRSLCRQLTARRYGVVGTDMSPVRVNAPELDSVQFHLVPPAVEDGFADALRSVAEQTYVELVVPTVSEELVVMARQRAADWPAPIVVGSAAAVVMADDKMLTCRRLAAAGVATPRFALPSDLSSARDVAMALGEPYLSKPRRGRGGRNTAVHKAADHAALDSFDDSLILQEFIPGAEYGPNLYLATDPNDDVVVVLEKTALAHGCIGNALGVRRVIADDVAAVAREAARALGLSGPVDIDVRRRADGTPVVLEINARFGANSAYAPEVLDALVAEYLHDDEAAA
jgi:carbamoylphosphate synthase large subunit